MGLLRRKEILEAHDLIRSPLAVQQEFWRRYNRGKGRGQRRATVLGDLTSTVMRENGKRSQSRLRRVSEAWRQVVPVAYRLATRVDFLSGGELRITVESSAAKFVLSRQVRDTLLPGLNAKLSGLTISGIRFRVGPVFGEHQAQVH